MRCPRCRRQNPGASWYCAHCGEPLADVNVAEGPPRRRTWLAAAGGGLVVALAGLAIWAATANRPPAVLPTPTATAEVVAGAPTAAPVPAVPVRPSTPRIVTATPGGDPGQPGASATPFVTPSRPPNGQPVWQVAFVTPPRLDGVLDEWRTPPVDITAVVFGQEYWTGGDDLSAQAVGGYDGDHLYLGLRVTDDVFSQPGRGVSLYLGDSLEVQLDADRHGDREVGQYNADDFQIGLSPGDFAGQGPEAHIWRPGGRSAGDIAIAARRVNDGYVLEAAIPWAVLGVDPRRTPSLGFALNVSDNDLPEPAQLTMISTTPNRSWSDPRTFGTLVLSPPGELPMANPTGLQGPPP